MLGCCQYDRLKSSQILHTGPLKQSDLLIAKASVCDVRQSLCVLLLPGCRFNTGLADCEPSLLGL